MSLRKKINLEINQGRTRILPCVLLCLYPFLVFFDIITTYLATPDLVYEGNPLIQILSLNWYTIISTSILFVSIVIILIKKTNDILFKKYILKITLEKKRIEIYLGVLVHIIFTYHFLFTGFAILNNTLSYFYLKGTAPSWLKIVLPSLHKTMLLPQYFLFIVAFTILAVLLLYARILYLKKKQ